MSDQMNDATMEWSLRYEPSRPSIGRTSKTDYVWLLSNPKARLWLLRRNERESYSSSPSPTITPLIQPFKCHFIK